MQQSTCIIIVLAIIAIVLYYRAQKAQGELFIAPTAANIDLVGQADIQKFNQLYRTMDGPDYQPSVKIEPYNTATDYQHPFTVAHGNVPTDSNIPLNAVPELDQLSKTGNLIGMIDSTMDFEGNVAKMNL